MFALLVLHPGSSFSQKKTTPGDYHGKICQNCIFLDKFLFNHVKELVSLDHCSTM